MEKNIIMKLKLVKANDKYQTLIVDMLKEWTEYNNSNPSADHSPCAIFKDDYRDFEYYINHLEVTKEEEGKVLGSVYFCLDEERNIMVGAVNIRHSLNDYLLKYGGHIGDGIRPSERRKGYATIMVGLALEKCKVLGIDKVLMVCSKNNIGSAKSIKNNGGILENEIIDNEEIEQRYWIDLN